MAVGPKLYRIARGFDRDHRTRGERAACIVDTVGITGDIGDIAFLQVDDAMRDRGERARIGR